VLTRPDLAIEIVSPDDEVGEMLTKVGDYLAAGIPSIWVVDPYKRTSLKPTGPASGRSLPKNCRPLLSAKSISPRYSTNSTSHLSNPT
jgi:Uma2 family endonuclease